MKGVMRPCFSFFLSFFFVFLFFFFLVYYIRNFVVTRNFGHPRTIFADSLHRQRDWKQRSVNETLETFSIAHNGPKSVRIKVSSPPSHDWRRQRNKILDIATRDTYVRVRVFFFFTDERFSFENVVVSSSNVPWHALEKSPSLTGNRREF